MTTTLIMGGQHPPYTKFKKSIKPPNLKMLKPGKNNKKLGWNITKGPHKGKKLYSLTLEERATCPTDCQQWDNCYMNNVPFGHRYDHTDVNFIPMLTTNIEELLRKHPEGIMIRLHVSGDFFSEDYVRYWSERLRLYP